MWLHRESEHLATQHCFTGLCTGRRPIQSNSVWLVNHPFSWNLIYKGNTENQKRDPCFCGWMVNWYGEHLYNFPGIYWKFGTSFLTSACFFFLLFFSYLDHWCNSMATNKTRPKSFCCWQYPLPGSEAWSKYPSIVDGWKVQWNWKNSYSSEYFWKSLDLTGNYRTQFFVILTLHFNFISVKAYSS